MKNVQLISFLLVINVLRKHLFTNPCTDQPDHINLRLFAGFKDICVFRGNDIFPLVSLQHKFATDRLFI